MTRNPQRYVESVRQTTQTLQTAIPSRSEAASSKYAEKSGLSAFPSVDFADFSALMEGIAGADTRQVVGSHVFQDFASKNGKTAFFLPRKPQL